MFLHNQLPRARPRAWRGLSRTVTENCNTQRRVTNPDVARSQNCEKATVSFVMCLSVCLSVYLFAWNNSAPTERIFVKFCTWGFFENLSRNLNFHYNVTRITGGLHEGLCTFTIESRSVPLRMRNVSNKSCRENPNTLFTIQFFFRKTCRLWDNVQKCSTAGQATYNNIIRRRGDAICIWNKEGKDTGTHSYLILLHNCLIPSGLVKSFTATLTTVQQI